VRLARKPQALEQPAVGAVVAAHILNCGLRFPHLAQQKPSLLALVERPLQLRIQVEMLAAIQHLDLY
jgi:hypothetical protein